MSSKITVVIAGKVIDRLGLKPGGKGHKFFMNRATDYMEPFLPRRDNGSVVDSLRQGVEYDKGLWHMRGPHIRYLFMGKVMAGKPKKPIDVDLKYTKSPNPQAGPRWDRAMMQSKGKQLTKEVQDYIKKHGG